MDIDTEKLELLFRERYRTLKVDGNEGATYENWIIYCNKYEIFLLHPEWLKETLNEDGLKGRICVHTPEPDGLDPSPWLLVPREFAERALVLGGLP
jgi:hypothetical protein